MAEYYDYITGQGIIVPDTSVVLGEIQKMFEKVFGDDLDLAATTTQGRLIEMFQRNRTFCIQICAAVSNMLNLGRATGFVLDDLGSLFLLERHPATNTSVAVTLSGVANTIIPVGTRLQTTAGDIFVNRDEYRIEPSGSVAAIYYAQETGEVPCVAGTLTVILDRVNGLETANNGSSPISTGHGLESDADFRSRIKQSLNVNSIAILSAIKSNLMAINGVKDSYCYDNYTDSSVTIDGKTIPAHSIMACVEGGADQDVAKVLYEKKTLGTGYITSVLTGANTYHYAPLSVGSNYIRWYCVEVPTNTNRYTQGTTVPNVGATIYDSTSWTTAATTVSVAPNSGTELRVQTVTDEAYGTQYKVSFIRPNILNLYVSITVARQGYSGADLSNAVKDAMMRWYNGEIDGVDGLSIGKSVSPFEISSAVSDVLPDIFINDVQVKIWNTGTFSPTTISVGATQKAELVKSRITVVII